MTTFEPFAPPAPRLTELQFVLVAIVGACSSRKPAEFVGQARTTFEVESTTLRVGRLSGAGGERKIMKFGPFKPPLPAAETEWLREAIRYEAIRENAVRSVIADAAIVESSGDVKIPVGDQGQTERQP